MNRAKSFSKRRQALSGVSERVRIEIESEHASVTGGFQNCFTVSAKSNRAIYKETSSFRGEELQSLTEQHGAMGRAHAPQRRSHHHRPVISFKDPSISNSKSRNRSLVFFRVWIGEHACFELVELPNFQIGQVAKHRHVA